MQSGQTNYQKPINYETEQLKSFARKNGRKLLMGGIILVALLVLINQCVFIVGEAEQAFVSRFGVIKRIIVNSENNFHEKYAEELKNEISLSENVQIVIGGGLQWKVPFVDRVERYSSRLYTHVSESTNVNTNEKKTYFISTFAQWHIADPALFSLKMRTMNSADNQLDNTIDAEIVQAINRMTAEDFVSNKDALNETLAKTLAKINKDMCVRGIEVKDLQIHRTSLPPANIDSTYARMQADRAKEAQKTRSEGQEEYQKSVADTDLKASKDIANAQVNASLIKAQGDAEALTTYAEAYGKDEDFFTYWRSLKALETAIDENTTLVLDKDHPLWKDLLAWATQK